MVFIALGLGVLVLLALLASARAFAAADPAAISRFLRWFLISLAGFAAVAVIVFLAASGRVALLLVMVTTLAPIVQRAWRSRQAGRNAGAAQGHTSDVETDTLRMRLDHDTGTITGTVRRGPFAGRRLDELGQADLFGLWRFCRADDEAAVPLLEAYLDRLMPDWRAAEAASSGTRSNGSGGNTGSAADALTRAEALAILGLAEGADAAAVKAAHRRLMMKLHPDHGGTTYLAAKLNRAREILLGE